MVLATKGTKGTEVLFNDMLGSSLGVVENGEFSLIERTSFGENLGVSVAPCENFFTGKPQVEGLGYSFLFRNYRADVGKWQTSDPFGYPDGWNNLAYCGNSPNTAIDYLGFWTLQIGLTFSGGGGVGGSFSFGIALGYSAESGFTAAFYETPGGGAEIGAEGSISGTVAISPANAVTALEGTALNIGASVGEGVTIGGDVNIPLDMQLQNTSVAFSIGFGLGFPVEEHNFVNNTFIQQIIANGGTVEE
jgi:RHS repeat-associated protein